MAHSRLLRALFILFVIAPIFISSAALETAYGANELIRIYPPTPSFFQPFFVTVSGTWNDSCVPVFAALEVAEKSVSLQAKTPGPLVLCQEAPTEWGFSVLVAPQRPDHYYADIFVISGITGERLSFVRHEFDIAGGMQSIPALPLANENVSLRLADLNSDSCVPAYVSHAVQGQTVTVEAQIPDLVCGQSPTPWQMEAALGSLAAGDYQVEMFVTDYRETPPQRTRRMQGSFVVVAQLLHTYLPLWGCFGSDISPLGCTAIQSPALRGVSP